MPLLTLLGGAAALAAGALGIGGHLDAQDKNEEAEKTRQMAQSYYDAAKDLLDHTREETQEALVNLGTTKQTVLENSMERFIRSFEKTKEIQMELSDGIDELENFRFSSDDAMEIQKLDSAYTSAISTDAVDTAAGAALLLAAGGSLPVLAEGASLAGTMLSIGEVGTAASIAGSAVGAAFAPLAAVAAPVVLFTGFTASMKADENLEKAQVMMSQAGEAVDKMETSRILCESITEKVKMFNGLINQLNEMFDKCSRMMEQMVDRRESERRKYKNKKLQSKDFTKDEKRLMAVTGALAKAMKAAIDTPMLKNDGSSGLTEEAESGFEDMKSQLPAFKEKVSIVEAAEPDGGYGSQEISFDGEKKDPLYVFKEFGRNFGRFGRKSTSKRAESPENTKGILGKARNVLLWVLCVLLLLTVVLSFQYLTIWQMITYVALAIVFCPKIKPECSVGKRILIAVGIIIFFVIPWGRIFGAWLGAWKEMIGDIVGFVVRIFRSIIRFITSLPVISTIWGFLHKVPILGWLLNFLGI